jgi:hypothetical protein
MRCSTSLRAQTIAEGSCSMTAAQTCATGAVDATDGGVTADRAESLGAIDAAELEDCVVAGLGIERLFEPADGSGGGTTRGGGVGDEDCCKDSACESDAWEDDGVCDDDCDGNCDGNCGGAIVCDGCAASGLLAIGVRAFFFRSCQQRAVWRGPPFSLRGRA